MCLFGSLNQLLENYVPHTSRKINLPQLTAVNIIEGAAVNSKVQSPQNTANARYYSNKQSKVVAQVQPKR